MVVVVVYWAAGRGDYDYGYHKYITMPIFAYRSSVPVIWQIVCPSTSVPVWQNCLPVDERASVTKFRNSYLLLTRGRITGKYMTGKINK